MATIIGTSPTVETCPVFVRRKTYVVKQRHATTLEHPLHLDGIPTAVANGANGLLVLREVTDRQGGTSYSVTATGANNRLVATLPTAWVNTNYAGINDAAWAVLDAPAPGGNIVASEPAWVVVERSILAGETTGGCPTLAEVRSRLFDSSRVENPLTQGREFADDQIVSALVRALADWNEVPPPPECEYTSTGFPYPHAWIGGACGYLLQEATHRFRRNKLALPGGIADPLDREDTYLRASELLLTEWRNFVFAKKWGENMRAQFGEVPGLLSGGYGGFGGGW